MTIIELVKREHDAMADQLDRLLVLARDRRRDDDVARLAARLVATARVHARAEERVLYAALAAATPALKAFALAGPHEHENLDTTLDKLLTARAGDELVVAARVARDLFESHARDQEEGEILPLVTSAFSTQRLASLAADMLAEASRIRPGVLRLVGLPARAA